MQSLVLEHLDDHLAAVMKVRAQAAFVDDLARRILSSLDAGGKVLFFGNGGSAADAQHIAAEFVVRYRQNRKALPAIALTTDTSVLTAHTNDFGFDTVYARQIEALARPGDVAIGISTSGASANVLAGLRAARERGCLAVAFTGEKACAASEIADITFHAPSSVTARIQECHLLVLHIVCEIVERQFVLAPS
jgi:D-sedoheptulose 7-phosphate isomerase